MEANIDELAPLGKLTEWLDAHVPELGQAPLKRELLHGGTSNVVLSLDRGGLPMVLRRPPAVPPPGAEKGVLREARILTALNRTDVPHPHCYGSCEDADVIGRPFYVMERVNGWAPNLRDERIHNEPPFDQMPYEYGIPFAIVDGLIKLANVDYIAIGLEDFGKPGKFLERQVDRWAGQLASYKQRYGYEGRFLPGYAETEAWLRANVLQNEVRGIIHGDVGTPNMMFQWGPPARLAAMIDWELSTIGDPMLDLGWFTGGMRDENDPGKEFPTALNNPANFPTKQELARYYCAGTGRDIRDFEYFSILAKFKSGCLLEYKVAQAEAGILPRETGRFFSRIVESCFAESAAQVARLG
ncbi:phosphotransferase family protein [Novosphingobium album (ex Liu et al. 2023)]|uniref:Phosphotransferase family protein n=1 Tax=Novosphingobium album (ex Liu et al. 2023) TaxID=3031130 RepID=A0ABT5WUG2_9SPHN|nr:phosphotransferase family protein [Novosphingobium album (ex Liu et al. 2023)]MDE8653518.1 phosphotransferase family protein [Novosphingobium album (ex Liu et al. 2023)]